MEERGTRPVWNRPVGWIVVVVVALTIIVPMASAKQQATPGASPAASPAGTPTPGPGATPIATKPTIMTRDDPKLGTILTDSDGRTLYMYSEDLPSQSSCDNKCAQAWPPFGVTGEPELAAGIPGSIGVTVRADGSNQVMYNGHPLYYFSGDTKPGDTNGQGIAGKWSVVHPAALNFGSPEASPAASPAA